MHPNVIAVIQGKGGVGKTSTVSALAGLFARSGRRILTVDVDPQANLGRDLGYYDEVDRRGDGGRALLGALHGFAIEPLREVRPHLDCITAGEATEQFAQLLTVQEVQRPGAAAAAIANALAPLVAAYDLVLIDCPPGNQLLQSAALGAAQYVLVPTRADDGSVDGLLKVDTVFARVVRTTNPHLHLLGAFLFGVGGQSRRIASEAEAAIAECLGGWDKVLGDPPHRPIRIRYAEGAAQDVRRLGRLPHELEEQLPVAQKARFAALRERRRTGGRHRAESAERISGSAAPLAADYAALAREVLQRIRAHRDNRAAANA